jgi:hypothetical protein
MDSHATNHHVTHAVSAATNLYKITPPLNVTVVKLSFRPSSLVCFVGGSSAHHSKLLISSHKYYLVTTHPPLLLDWPSIFQSSTWNLEITAAVPSPSSMWEYMRRWQSSSYWVSYLVFFRCLRLPVSLCSCWSSSPPFLTSLSSSRRSCYTCICSLGFWDCLSRCRWSPDSWVPRCCKGTLPFYPLSVLLTLIRRKR